MTDLTWKIFCATGNIDTYLLYKELESEGNLTEEGQFQAGEESMGHLEMKP
jgi:hypothetical protein